MGGAHPGQDARTTLIAVAGDDPRHAARAWSLLLRDRLSRTAVELHEATKGSGRMFIDVAGPALLVAANLLNVLNQQALTQEQLRETIEAADGNLTTARSNLGLLRERLRREGFDLP